MPSADELPDIAYRSPEHRVAVQTVGIRTLLAVPMVVRGRTLGALTFGWQSRSLPDRDRTQLAEQIARRVGLALENSSLYQEAHGERERLAALMRQLPLGVIIAETSSRKLLFTNERAQALLGTGASERSIAGPHAELIHLALGGESASDVEIDVIRADGTRGLVSLSAEPVRAPDGEIVAAVATLFDMTEHRRREEALAFLAEASVVLTETLDLQHTLSELVELAVPRLADWCSIDMLDHGEIRTMGVAHADPETARLARRLHARRPVRKQASSGVSAALSTGRSQLIQDVPAWLADAGDRRRGAGHDVAHPRRPLLHRRAARGPRARFRRADARDHGFRAALLGAGHGDRRGARAPRGAGDRERAALQRGARHRARPPAEPAAGHARRSRPASRSSRATGRRARAPRSEATSTTPGRPATHYFLAIGDVAGHGPAAAALTSLTRQAMRVVSRYEQSPGRILAVVNDTIRAQSAPEQFCTAALAVLRQVDDGYEVTVACAGHPPPVVVRAIGGVEEIGFCGPLLGVLPQREYDDRKCQVALGDLVAFWTDGVTERRHRAAMFGEERLLSLLGGLANRAASDVAREIDDAVMNFAPGLPDDDVAILIARVTGAPVERPRAPAALAWHAVLHGSTDSLRR